MPLPGMKLNKQHLRFVPQVNTLLNVKVGIPTQSGCRLIKVVWSLCNSRLSHAILLAPGTILREPRSVGMQTAEGFRKHAQEFRAMAKRARSPVDRGMLLNMAKTWEELALVRVAQMARRERTRGIAAALIPSIV
jgi:hypothetical protein